jgi:hypothetical protein
MRAWRWAALVVVLACLSGCTATVDGTAMAASEGALTTAPAPSSTPPSTPTSTPPARTTTNCSGGTVIQPKGAPYCYLLPSGFDDVTGELTRSYRSASPSEYESAVAAAVHDVIFVAVYPLSEDSDGLSAAVLGDQVDSVLRAGESAGFTRTGALTPATVDGARTFLASVKQNEGRYASAVYFVFRGSTEIEINCQYADRQADVERGCAGVRRTIQITDAAR